MTIPAWLNRHLEAIGQANPDGITRTARARRCPRCKAVLLTGLDAPRCAFAVRVDPHPLDAAGELASLLVGRPTYRATAVGTNYELDHRAWWNVRNSPPSDAVVVLAAHRCGKPLSTQPLPDPHPIRLSEETSCLPF